MMRRRETSAAHLHLSLLPLLREQQMLLWQALAQVLQCQLLARVQQQQQQRRLLARGMRCES